MKTTWLGLSEKQIMLLIAEKDHASRVVRETDHATNSRKRPCDSGCQEEEIMLKTAGEDNVARKEYTPRFCLPSCPAAPPPGTVSVREAVFSCPSWLRARRRLSCRHRQSPVCWREQAVWVTQRRSGCVNKNCQQSPSVLQWNFEKRNGLTGIK